MLPYRTVFVIGAGASHEVGLPVGIKLKETISQKLDLYTDFRSRDLKGDYDILQRLTSSFRNELGLYVEAAMKVKKGIVLSASIDDFIHIHKEDSKIATCGKLAIAKSILEAEAHSKLWVDTYNSNNTINFSASSNTWYMGFYQLLTQGVPKQKIGNIFDNVTLIIFNYDRCIEHYLTHAISQNYIIPLAEAAKIVERIKVYRPYGSVGDYFGEERIDFGSKNLPSTEKIIDSLKTYSEELTNFKELEEMRSAIDASLRIVFLGNAYHENNMKLLFDERFTNGKDVSPKRIFATRLGISDEDLNIVRRSFDEVQYRPQALPNGSDKYYFANSCAELFRDYRMSLKSSIT